MNESVIWKRLKVDVIGKSVFDNTRISCLILAHNIRLKNEDT